MFTSTFSVLFLPLCRKVGIVPRSEPKRQVGTDRVKETLKEIVAVRDSDTSEIVLLQQSFELGV